MLLHHTLAKGTIAWFCGSLKGTSQGGLKNLLSPQVGTSPHIMTTPPTSIQKLTTPIQINLEEQLQSVTLDTVDATSGNQVLLEHLMVDFCHAQSNEATVVAKLQSGLHNPIGPNPMLLPIEDGQVFSLKQHLDFLAHGHKPITTKRLSLVPLQ
jgi:hypothetical protein